MTSLLHEQWFNDMDKAANKYREFQVSRRAKYYWGAIGWDWTFISMITIKNFDE